jgi:diguanylate cyclase (GGDEF)-like protein
MKKRRLDPHTTQRLRIPVGAIARPGARLVVIHGESLGLCVELIDKPVTIGRAPGCEMQIDHRSVSRMHCTVWAENGHFHVRDLGSTNRTLVNEHAIDRSELKDGDTIAVGEIVMKFLRRESLEDRYHQALVELATVDVLTQLPNRRVWREGLERAVLQAQAGTPLCMAFIDLDHFKRINDELGHLAGDEVLKGVAAVIRASLLSRFHAGRLGGEEFAVALPGLSLRQATDYAELLRRAIEALRIELAGTPRAITASLGVVQWAPSMQTSADFMRAADAELFRAKAAGRNRVCVHGVTA